METSTGALRQVLPEMFELLHQSPTTTAATFVVAALIVLTLHSYTRNRGRKLPPGPPGDPIIGHARFMKDEFGHLYNTELNKTYGTPLDAS